MIALLQRVSQASVTVEDEIIADISLGLLVFVAIQQDDRKGDISRLAERILTYRIFPDADGRMNRSVTELSGGLLLVPQFTLAADTRKGARPSFSKAAAPEKASSYFDTFVTECSKGLENVATGCFGADMQVSLINDGPVTFWLES